MIVNPVYYYNVYMGQEADQASFPALCARAEDVINTMAHWQLSEETIGSLPPIVKTLAKKSICAQIDFFALNGLDSIDSDSGRGFTVGKVSISGKSGSDLVRTGAMADHIAPMAKMYLEQSGLMNPAVPVLGGML